MFNFSGAISLDGRDIKSVPRELLRSRITTITQEGVLLKGSLRFNLFPFAGSQPTDVQIASALTSVGLMAHVQSHGSFDDDIVVMCLSTSQKQLLFIARAILHQRVMHTNVVLIDEATSALDDTTNQQIQGVMAEAFQNCTVLQVAHRSTASDDTTLAVTFESGGVERTERRAWPQH